MISRLTRLIDARIQSGTEIGQIYCWTGLGILGEYQEETCAQGSSNSGIACKNCALDSVEVLHDVIIPIQSAVSNCYPDPRASDVHAAECERAFRRYMDGQQDAQ